MGGCCFEQWSTVDGSAVQKFLRRKRKQTVQTFLGILGDPPGLRSSQYFGLMRETHIERGLATSHYSLVRQCYYLFLQQTRLF